MTGAPRWRATFDALEREVSPRLQAALGSEQFAVAVGIAAQLRRTVQEQASRSSRRVLHQLNLPAGTDVSRILTEVGQLRQQVRQLQQELDEARADREPPQRRPAGAATKRSPGKRSAATRATSARSRAAGGGERGAAGRSQRARRADPA